MAIPAPPISSPSGSFVNLRVDSVSVDATWLAIELTYTSV